jgi:hypothetical protein
MKLGFRRSLIRRRLADGGIGLHRHADGIINCEWFAGGRHSSGNQPA